MEGPVCPLGRTPRLVSSTYDAATAAGVTAFQRHFRPERVDGIADASIITTLRDLTASLPGPATA
jgi:N-acetylmuramoyl-L-alanine amidase